MNVMRDELGQVALKVCQNSHQGHLLQVPPMKACLKSRWREATWIDLMFAVDHGGDNVNYDKHSQTDQPANMLRIWFTSVGTGFGLRSATKTGESNPLGFIAVDRYPELAPAQSANKHDLRLAGIRGRTNSCLAHWVPGGCTTDEGFTPEVKQAWNDLGGFLNGHWALNN